MLANVNAGQPESHVWCETTLKYSEYGNSPESKKETADYNLRLHKNGTQVMAAYDIWKGTDATWKFTYYPEDDDEVSMVTCAPTRFPKVTNCHHDRSSTPLALKARMAVLPQVAQQRLSVFNPRSLLRASLSRFPGVDQILSSLGPICT